jgi:hypothetical protein
MSKLCAVGKALREKEAMTRAEEGEALHAAYQCFWTWPWGHCWHAAPYPTRPFGLGGSEWTLTVQRCCHCGRVNGVAGMPGR